MKHRILLIDDEPQIKRFMAIALETEGYEFASAASCEAGLDSLRIFDPDLVVLDLGLPDGDGFDVLTQIRQSSLVPVLILTARDEEEEKVKLLNGGANDYLSKPFGIKELVARINALLRYHRDIRSQSIQKLSFADLVIDTGTHQVKQNDTEINLTRKEFLLLKILTQYHGQLVTSEKLLIEIWGPTFVDNTHYIRILVSQLRKKLNDNPDNPKYIHTEAGVGYRILDNPSFNA